MSSVYRLMDVSLEPEVQNQVWARQWPSGGPREGALLSLPASGYSSYYMVCGWLHGHSLCLHGHH